MGLMDRVKEQAAQLAQKTQEAAHEGKIKLDQAAAKRRADAMFRELGAAVYADRTGRGGADTAAKIERLVKALSDQEAEQGLGEAGSGSGEAAREEGSSGGTAAGGTPGGTAAGGTPGGTSGGTAAGGTSGGTSGGTAAGTG
jgi:hypothetical protein